jgi:hypothetical protein
MTLLNLRFQIVAIWMLILFVYTLSNLMIRAPTDSNHGQLISSSPLRSAQLANGKRPIAADDSGQQLSES